MQFKSCAPVMYPVATKNSFVTEGPVNLNFFLKSCIH